MPLSAPASLPSISKRLPFGNINNIYTRNLATGGGGSTGGSNKQTFSTIANAPCSSFDFVRVVFKNIQTTTFGVASLIVAPTNANTNKIVPSVGNTLTNDGGVTGWQVGTFGGNLTGTVPAKGATAREAGVLTYDWIPCKSVARLDANGKPYIMARTRFDTSVNGNSVGYYTIAGTPTDSTTNYYQESYFTNGDFTTDPSTLTSSSTSTLSPFFAFEFMSLKQAIRVLCIGDSITQGTGATNASNSWVNRAQELAFAQSLPFNMINFGSAGAKTDEYSGFGTPGIAYHKPAIVCYSAYSPNDAATPTQATFDIMFRRWIAIANAAQAQGALPVAVFLAPNNNLATTEDNLRKAFIARVKAGGYPVIDLTTVTGDSATPQRYITGLNTDNLHPNDAGYDAMAVAFLAQLLALVLQTCTL